MAPGGSKENLAIDSKRAVRSGHDSYAGVPLISGSESAIRDLRHLDSIRSVFPYLTTPRACSYPYGLIVDGTTERIADFSPADLECCG